MFDMAQSARRNVTLQSGVTRKDWELSRSFLLRQESRSAGDGLVVHIRACAGMTEKASVLWFLSSEMGNAQPAQWSWGEIAVAEFWW